MRGVQAWRLIFDSIRQWSRRRAKTAAQLRALWAGSNDVQRPFELIRMFHDYRGDDPANVVDDKTWSDLEMDEVFKRMDRTVSCVGRQYLYALLRRWEDEQSELDRREALCSRFRSDPTLRETIQRELLRLRQDDAYFVVTFLFEELPEKPPVHILFYLSSIAFFASLVLGFFFHAFFMAAALLAVLNLVINVVYGRRVFQYFDNLTFLSTLLTVAGRLSRQVAADQIREVDVLRKHRRLARRLNKRVFWLCVDESRLGDLSAALMNFLNLFGLTKLVAFVRSLEDLRSRRQEIREIYEAVGSLDALLAAASYRDSLGMATRPAFNRQGRIDVTGIYHPLLANPVANSFRLESPSALVTGSNLAGKTTFIKTIGVNLILSRTLLICLAERADLPDVRVRASIQHDDRVVDGHSYYSREIEQIGAFAVLPRGRYLFLIDEIFRGTNTIERIAIARATIRYLSARNLVLVTTHDVELQDLLAESSRMFHFSEVVEDGRYFFDYRLRPGPCGAGNAIKLIELRGFPDEVVEEARRFAAGRRGPEEGSIH
ncbi:MAG: hypothetical protein WAO20_15670 [Acidobacteriota bacterium]